MSALTSLQESRPSNTQVTGDIGNLRALKNLQHLCLTNTQVTGDSSSFSALTSMRCFRLGDTKVKGDFSRLSALKSLQTLYFLRAKMTDGVRSILSVMDLIVLTYACQIVPVMKALAFVMVQGDLSRMRVQSAAVA